MKIPPPPQMHLRNSYFVSFPDWSFWNAKKTSVMCVVDGDQRANFLQLTTTVQFTYNRLVNRSTPNLPHQIRPKQSQIFTSKRKWTNEMHKRKCHNTTLTVAQPRPSMFITCHCSTLNRRLREQQWRILLNHSSFYLKTKE